MAGSHIAVTPGSGDFIATGATYTEASTVVKDQKVIVGEPYLASYTVETGGVSTATTGAHALQIMAGSTLNVRIRRIEVSQGALAGGASAIGIILLRLTSAGTGGGAITPSPLDTSDAASGASAMTLPSAKGTEGTAIWQVNLPLWQTAPIGVIPLWTWEQPVYGKPLIIPAGTANGVALKLGTGVATSTIEINVYFTETPF